MVGDSQHKKLSRDNKRLIDQNKQLELQLKCYREEIEVGKQLFESKLADMDNEKLNHKKTRDDLSLLQTELEQLQIKYQDAMSSNSIMESKLKNSNHLRIQKSDIDPFSDLYRRSDEEFSSLSDTEINQLRHSIDQAKRQTFLSQKNLDVAIERLTQVMCSRLCIVCTERPTNVVLMPCLHRQVCEICAPRIAICPVCSVRIQNRVISSSGSLPRGQQSLPLSTS